MDTRVKLGCGLVLLSGWDALRREVRERPRQRSVPMSEPTDDQGQGRRVRPSGAGAGLRPASWVGNRPLAERTGAGTGALRRNGGFRSAKASERGGPSGCWGSSLRASLPVLLPLPLPLPWFRALPRADSERRAGPKVEGQPRGIRNILTGDGLCPVPRSRFPYRTPQLAPDSKAQREPTKDDPAAESPAAPPAPPPSHHGLVTPQSWLNEPPVSQRSPSPLRLCSTLR